MVLARQARQRQRHSSEEQQKEGDAQAPSPPRPPHTHRNLIWTPNNRKHFLPFQASFTLQCFRVKGEGLVQLGCLFTRGLELKGYESGLQSGTIRIRYARDKVPHKRRRVQHLLHQCNSQATLASFCFRALTLLPTATPPRHQPCKTLLFTMATPFYTYA